MSSRKQRRKLAEKRMAFDRKVEENRKNFHKPFDEMTKSELIAYAYEHEIDIDTRAKKADILEAVKG